MTHSFERSAPLRKIVAVPEAAQNSRFYKIHPALRVCLSLFFALFLLGVVKISSLMLCLLLAVGMACWAKLPFLASLKRVLIMESFLVFTVIMLPFTHPGTDILTIAGVDLSQEGLSLAVRVLLIANSSTLMLLTMIGTIEPALIGRTLKSLYFPARFVFLIDFSVRYMGVLHDEYLRGREAMRARCFHFLSMRKKQNWFLWRQTIRQAHLHRYRAIGYLFAMGLVRAIERAESIYEAMLCRGYQDVRQYRFPICLTGYDRGVISIFCIFLGAVIAWDILG